MRQSFSQITFPLRSFNLNTTPLPRKIDASLSGTASSGSVKRVKLLMTSTKTLHSFASLSTPSNLLTKLLSTKTLPLVLFPVNSESSQFP